MKTLLRFVMLPAVAWLCGCASNGRPYGSHDYDVILETNPPNAPIYIIPSAKWNHDRDRFLRASDDDLRPFYKGDTTYMPPLPAENSVFLTRDPQGNNYYKEFHPADTRKVVINFGPHPTTQADPRQDR